MPHRAQSPTSEVRLMSIFGPKLYLFLHCNVSIHTNLMFSLAFCLLCSFAAAGNTYSGESSTRVYDFVENPISSPVNTYEGCRQWFHEVAKRNQEQCDRPIIFPAKDLIFSMDGHQDKVYEDVTKVSDGNYRCRPPRNFNGCNNDFLSWFQQQRFYILCRHIDGVETQLLIDPDQWVMFGGRTIGRDPELTLMWCGKQLNHGQLVAAREQTVDQVRQILISHLGHDLTSCIDQRL